VGGSGLGGPYGNGLGARGALPYGDGLGARGALPYGNGLGARGAYGDGLGARYNAMTHLDEDKGERRLWS
jgi:hypothetical protein